MVEAAIHQLQWDDLPMKPFTEERIGSNIRPLPIAPEPAVSNSQQIAGTFEMMISLKRENLIAVQTEPIFEMRLFTLPLGIAESARHGLLPHHHSRVRCKREIRQSLDRP